MSKKVTEHKTATGSVLFMAAAKAFTNKKTNKSEYSIKVKLQSTDQAVAHLSEIAEYKVDTKTNRALEGTGEVVINFATDYAPIVTGADGAELKGREIPFFDGRKDTGSAIVSYKVIDYGNNKIVRLSGIQLLELNLAPRGEDTGVSVDELEAQIKGNV
jgi:hypothetical protein